MTLERTESWAIANTKAGTILTYLTIAAMLLSGFIWVNSVGTRADKAQEKATVVEQELAQERADILPRLERIENLLLSQAQLNISGQSRKSNIQKHIKDVQHSNVSNDQMPE